MCNYAPAVVLFTLHTVYPMKYAHGFVVLCFVVVMQPFIMNSHEVSIHIHQGRFAGTGAIVRLPQCQWSKPDGYGKISQCITTTKHSKAKTVCIFLGIYCRFVLFTRPRLLVILRYACVFYLDLYSLNGKTSYPQTSWSLEATKLVVILIVSFWNLTGVSAALLPRCLSNFGTIGKVKTEFSLLFQCRVLV